MGKLSKIMITIRGTKKIEAERNFKTHWDYMIPARTDSRIRYEYESVCRELDKLHDKFNKVMKVQGQSQADMTPRKSRRSKG